MPLFFLHIDYSIIDIQELTRRWTSSPHRRHGCLHQLHGLLWPWSLTADLQNLIRSSIGANEYSLSDLLKLCKPFMRYQCRRTNERTRQTNCPTENIMPSPTLSLSGGEGVKMELIYGSSCYFELVRQILWRTVWNFFISYQLAI